MIPCHVVRALAPKYIAHTVSGSTGRDIEQHLSGCEACRVFYRQAGCEETGWATRMVRRHWRRLAVAVMVALAVAVAGAAAGTFTGYQLAGRDLAPILSIMAGAVVPVGHAVQLGSTTDPSIAYTVTVTQLALLRDRTDVYYTIRGPNPVSVAMAPFFIITVVDDHGTQYRALSRESGRTGEYVEHCPPLPAGRRPVTVRVENLDTGEGASIVLSSR